MIIHNDAAQEEKEGKEIIERRDDSDSSVLNYH